MKPLWAVAGVALLGAAGAGTLTAAYVVLPREEEVGSGDSQAQPVDSADFLVTTTADAVDAAPGDGACATAEGECSLRAAVQEANALAGAQSVELPAGTYVLTAGEIHVRGEVSISGVSWETTIIDGARSDRVFNVPQNSNLELSATTIRNGLATQTPEIVNSGEGGAIHNLGTLVLEDVALLDNVATFAGGALANRGNATLISTQIKRNVSPNGGAIGNSLGGGPHNQLLMRDSIVAENRDNFAGSRGGVFVPTGAARIIRSSIVNNFGTGIMKGNYGELIIEASLISGNSTQGDFEGGGVVAGGVDPVWISNSTISGNSAGGNGGGIAGVGKLRMNNVTLVSNTADANGNGSGDGGGIYWANWRLIFPSALYRRRHSSRESVPNESYKLS